MIGKWWLLGRDVETAWKDMHGTADPGRERADSFSGQSVTDGKQQPQSRSIGESGSHVTPVLAVWGK